MAMIKGAALSQCGLYRYDLTRAWDSTKPNVMFIGLNPSTADAKIDDPTIIRCIDFAKRFGGGSLRMMNLFAYRATNPKDMVAADYPVGSENDKYLRIGARKAGTIIAAWGNHGKLLDRDKDVMFLLEGHRIQCLGNNKSGSPKHPLYLGKNTPLVDYKEK